MILLLTAAFASSELPACAEAPADPEAQAALTAAYEAAQTAGSTEGDIKNRTKAVMKLHKKGLVCTADDHYKAGLVLFQSRDAEVLHVAHELALVAAHHHVDRAKWLANNTFDRWQISLGNRQRFGTQIGRDGECLYPIDETFPDDNRVAWGAPPLEETYAAFLKRRELDGVPNATTLNSLGLFCRLAPW
ncbi:MAG: hypothetical protein R3F61_36295 [Myxococcota bacterium]